MSASIREIEHRKAVRGKKLVIGVLTFCVFTLPAVGQGDTRVSQLQSAAGCIESKDTRGRKAQLEQGIRQQVKFEGEAENLLSFSDIMSQHKIPAMSLALIHQGKIEWADVYQSPGFYPQQSLDCNSLFQAASLSKPVTVMAALRMSAAGELDLDKNVQDYLKDFVLPPGKQSTDNPVTMRNIFSHTSGISPGGYQGYAQNAPVPSDMDILKGSSGVNTPAIAVVNVPGETLAYSGGAYTLAELALEDIYSDAFANIMRKWVLDPLAMDNADFTQPLPVAKHDRVARGYLQSGEMIEGGWRNHPEQAAAGLWSNALDLAKFMLEMHAAYHGKSRVFSQADIQSLIDQERDGLAYGFILNRADDSVFITHYGGNAGYRTGMTIDLVSGNGLVYLINSDNGGALGNALLLSASAIYGWQQFTQTVVKRKQVETTQLKALAGDYKWNNQIDLSVSFDAGNERISLHFPNGDAYELTPFAGEQLDFIHPGTGVSMSFLKEHDFKQFSLYGQTAIKSDTAH